MAVDHHVQILANLQEQILMENVFVETTIVLEIKLALHVVLIRSQVMINLHAFVILAIICQIVRYALRLLFVQKKLLLIQKLLCVKRIKILFVV